MMAGKQFHLHLISDSTGETIAVLAKAVRALFTTAEAVEHAHNLVRGDKALRRALDDIEAQPGPVMFSVLDAALRAQLQQTCARLGVPAMSVLDPFIAPMERFLGVGISGRPGSQHIIDDDYMRRMEALNYSLHHDDGQNMEDLGSADIILVGVSRTSKTPTCMYLAHRGIKAANVPLVPSAGDDTARALVPPSPLLTKYDSAGVPLIVGLTVSPSHLTHIRKSRILTIASDDASASAQEAAYSDISGIRAELAEAQRLFARYDWPVIDITRRSVEEAASAILNLYYERQRENDHGET